MSVIEFNNFSFRYKGNQDYALNNINLNIGNNKFILLLGETGSGKTSLIKCMNGLIPQFYSGFYKGSVEVLGLPSDKTPVAEMSTMVGVVFQNAENQLVAMNVEQEIAFGLENLGISRDIMQTKIESIVKLIEIEDILNKAPFEISGGEQQKVAIASVLVLEPEVLVLDEPTGNLDPISMLKIIDLLKTIQEKKKITVIISEHRTDYILPLIDEIILMKNGQIIDYGERDKVLNGPLYRDTPINKPFLYQLFSELKEERLFDDNIPVSIEDALKIILSLR